MTRWIWSPLFLVAAAGGCAPLSASELDLESAGEHDAPIVGGRSTKAFPGVGALTVGGATLCTATVVAPRIVVTAAHCLAGRSAASMQFVLGPRVSAPTAVIRVAAIEAHPAYDPARITDDIGIVTLAADAPVEPVKVLASMDASWIGAELVFVGFGLSNGVARTGEGVKRAVRIAIDEVGAKQFAYHGAGKNTCSGDSGGPAFALLDGEMLLAGVTSYGDPTCSEYGVDTRVDPYKSFIDASTDATSDGCEGESYEGRCDGDAVVWCEDNRARTVSCERGCALDRRRGIADCV